MSGSILNSIHCGTFIEAADIYSHDVELHTSSEGAVAAPALLVITLLNPQMLYDGGQTVAEVLICLAATLKLRNDTGTPHVGRVTHFSYPSLAPRSSLVVHHHLYVCPRLANHRQIWGTRVARPILHGVVPKTRIENASHTLLPLTLILLDHVKPSFLI